jgi:hypothetical protein
VGVFIFAGIASLAVLPLPPLLVFKAAVLIGALSSATLATYWLTQAINTIYLNQGAKTSQEITQAEHREPSTPPTQGTRLDHIARIVLERHYLDNAPATPRCLRTNRGFHPGGAEPGAMVKSRKEVNDWIKLRLSHK